VIIFFGPAGAGKSVQGQLLAAHHGWRWLSAGQLLRDTHDHELLKEMSTGNLVDNTKVNAIVAAALKRAHDVDHVVLDGFPRHLDQAKWLIASQPEHGRSISAVVVIDAPKEELVHRLHLRGRLDDTPDAIEERLAIFEHEIAPILDYFASQQVKIIRIDGTGAVAQVHDRIEAELRACSLV